MIRIIILALALSACTDIDSLSQDLIGEQFGEVYNCYWDEYPIGEAHVHVDYKPCLLDGDEAAAFSKQLEDDCIADLNKRPVGGGCFSNCVIEAIGLDVCKL